MFIQFATAVHARFVELSRNELFVVQAPELFEQYLAAYPAGTNPVFRTRTYYDCNCCKQFVRRLGVVVALKNGEVQTVWGNLDVPEPFQSVASMLDVIVRGATITSVFRTKERQYGVDHNYDNKTNERYDHFFGRVDAKHFTANADTVRGEFAAAYQVFQRGLQEIREQDIATVLDLIDSNALYRGQEHKEAILGFRELLRGYNGTDVYVWERINHRNARFRNTVIGTLLTDLASGVEIEQAVRSFESKVAPSNYKRTTSIITQRMVEDAVETLNKLGLGGAIYRRFARLSDVSVNDVLFVSNGVQMKDHVSALLEADIKPKTPDLKNAEEVFAEAFVKHVLPGAKKVELFVENRHTGNFVSLTGSDGPERLFKWNNNFAWSYDGNVTDSVKQRVKAAGGNIEADLRISLSWFNTDDLDLHAETPYGHVFFMQKMGILDVDMNVVNPVRNAVENLAFNRPKTGVYRVYVHQYRRRETTDLGFSIEIEQDGVIRQFHYAKAVKEYVECFTFSVLGGKITSFASSLPEGNSSQEKWGVKTETLVPVSTILYSPNHWNGQSVGAKHLIFALQGCKNPEPTRGIYNEFLRSDLEKHRKVFEVLGSRTKCEPTDEQISGVGFTAARGDSVTVVVDGRRSYKVHF